MKSRFRQIDSYGHPISITLNGDSTYKTSIGAFATVVSRVLILGYFAFEMLGVINHDSVIK